MSKFANLSAGDPAPWFKQRSMKNPKFVFDSAGGRYIVLLFFRSTRDPWARQRFDAVVKHNARFNDRHLCFFGVTNDPTDEDEGRLRERNPGIRYFFDFDGSVAKLYGALDDEADDPLNGAFRPRWVFLTPRLQIAKIVPFAEDGSDCDELGEFIADLEPLDSPAGIRMHAPVVMIPRVFEPEFCAELISLYETHGGQESSFMRDVGGKTTYVQDAKHKRRADYVIKEKEIIAATREKFLRRVIPEIKKVHQYDVTRMERYIVACYDAKDGGHFSAHRDNTTIATAHRRFAASINLNSEFEGGEVSFPEYGMRGFKPPVGGAVVFSCSLLHKVSPVTSGRRYAFLPFLYDDAAAVTRQEGIKYLDVASAGTPDAEKDGGKEADKESESAPAASG